MATKLSLRYDREQGCVLLLSGEGALVSEQASFRSVDDVVQAAAARQVPDGPLLACLVGYGLALAVQQWRGRPIMVWRAALIQAAEQLRTAAASSLASALLDEALRRADASLLTGEEVEASIIAFVDAELLGSD